MLHERRLRADGGIAGAILAPRIGPGRLRSVKRGLFRCGTQPASADQRLRPL